MTTVLLLGSAPMVTQARDWPRAPFDQVLAINNAWAVRSDWDALIHPWDFPIERQPIPGAGQRIVNEADFVPTQNRYGGFVYGGGTMVFSAGYWALASLKPRVIAVFGCDMQYPDQGQTHFYGQGSPDPLRADITLRSLEAKSARLMILAASEGCAMVNLSTGPSRLLFPRAVRETAADHAPMRFNADLIARARQAEADLGYFVPSGRYWEQSADFDADRLDAIDALWLAAANQPA